MATAAVEKMGRNSHAGAGVSMDLPVIDVVSVI